MSHVYGLLSNQEYLQQHLLAAEDSSSTESLCLSGRLSDVAVD